MAGNKAVGKHNELPHIEWVDLGENGVAIEVVVVKRDPRNDDLYFIKTEDLDQIDRNRLTQILRKRDAGKYELWDLLDNTVLGNGENALEFFHQLVRVRTARGQILVPGSGRAGIALRPEDDGKRGPGRPPNQV
jgi:hypothetical protein